MLQTERKSDFSTNGLPWSQLSGCNVLVTGATGLIGGCLVDALMSNLNKEYNVYASGRNEEYAFSRFSAFAEDKSFHFIKYDVLEPLQSDVDFDYIIHAASYAAPNAFATDPVGIMKANFDGVANLLDYGLRHHLHRFLYISSGEVYGNGCQNKWMETDSGYIDTLNPRSCYPSSKRAAETLCAAYSEQYGVDVIIARLCHTYGPKFTEKDNRAFAQFINKARNGEDIVLKSRGNQYRSWIYIDDCVDAILTILLKGTKGEAYNVADEKSCITIREFAETVAEISGQKVLYDVEKSSKTESVITKAIFDTTKLQSLGWEPKHSIKEGVTKSIYNQK